MLRKLTIRTAIFVCLLSTSASGEGMFLLNGGVSIPTGPDPFKDFWGAGISLGGGGGVTLGDSKQPALLVSVDYNRHPIDGDAFLSDLGVSDLGVSLSGGSITLLNLMANLRFNLTPVDAKASPYFIGGVGMFRLSVSDIVATGGGQVITEPIDAAETKLGIGFGAGVDINVGENVGLFIEAKYGIGFTEDESTHHLPIKAGLIYRQ